MITTISANDLKVKGITAIDELVANNTDGVVVTVRGKEKYVILPIDEYNHLREYELEMAIQEAKNDISNGKFHNDGIAKHLERVSSDV
ncbi:type II toxin-antitoxin system prevent-host-death family antitoxin [Gracilinema caldarium]|uniref:Prevent-host-death family protein n=1 Tax=Gracilinema caldarium (strain ATCC 51460 / DSM 7334 / H1) TaxID=744872 RepID=F8F377_GRAC1|nr:type II toxin-antitoxin system prevent-host-death family antitoxin [Gracilinema caldarium]AEJ20403.1 prevent-host-death family protein [Gracilinema caldarium DSM 7334]